MMVLRVTNFSLGPDISHYKAICNIIFRKIRANKMSPFIENKHKRGKDSSVIHFKKGIRSFCCFL